MISVVARGKTVVDVRFLLSLLVSVATHFHVKAAPASSFELNTTQENKSYTLRANKV